MALRVALELVESRARRLEFRVKTNSEVQVIGYGNRP